MLQNKTKIVAVVGPTASGKSDLSVDLALHLGGEVVSADSRQVYRGMDIGTGKITKEEMKGVPHHLLDVTDPMETLSAGTYKTLAEKAIDGIIARGHLPILCGGTGFYIQSVVDGLALPDVPPNPKLRAELAKKSPEKLYVQLAQEDPSRAATIDPKNPHRLIRALEIIHAIGKVPKVEHYPRYETLLIGITLPDALLKERIHQRLLSRLKNGMIEEVARLHEEGMSWERMEELGLEYRYLSRYLQGNMDDARLCHELEREIIHYAKRQLTWFRKDQRIHWVERGDLDTPLRLIKDALAKVPS